MIQQNCLQKGSSNMKKIGKLFEAISCIFFGILFIVPITIIMLIYCIGYRFFLSKQFKKIKKAGYKISKAKVQGCLVSKILLQPKRG